MARSCAAMGRARAVAGESGKWWAPLLGWSGKADYIEAPTLAKEKARELRARMAETESFHDAMYHSAIASRLAHSA
uniref:Uncharacterized protein n=1 Tax=Oryza nivara TaxID=4536 RepID=A0A0E0HAL6_ORYNI